MSTFSGISFFDSQLARSFFENEKKKFEKVK
jgi:hypothetical protein